MIFRLNTTGKLEFYQPITSGTTVIVETTNTCALVDCTLHDVALVVTRETAVAAGSVSFYIDAILFETKAIAQGTPASAIFAAAMQINGYSASRYAGTCSFAATYNRALTAAEVLDLYRNGISYSDKWGSQTTVYTSNFTAGTDSWIVARGIIAGNIDSIGGVNDVLRFTCDNTANTHPIYRAASTLVPYQNYRYTFDYYIPSGQSNINGVRLTNNSISFITDIQTQINTWTTVTGEFISSFNGEWYIFPYSSGNLIFTDSGGDDLLYLKNIIFTKIGATLALEPEGIQNNLWYDSSSNALNASYPAAGWSLTRKQLKGLFASPIYTDGTNVGIGTTNPVAMLDVSSGAVSGLHQDISAGHRDFLFQSIGDAVIQIASDNAGSVGAGIVFTNQEGVADGRHWIIQHKGTSEFNRFSIGYLLTINQTSNLMTGGSEPFVISTTGNVGIGTTAPKTTLQVGDSGGVISIGGNSTVNSSSYFKLCSSNSTWNWQIATNNKYSGALEFQSSDANGGTVFTYTNQPTISLYPGKVGINIYPLQALHVIGTTRISTLAGTGTRAVYSTADGDLTNTSSDKSLKKSVEPIPYGIEEVLLLNPIRFEWTQPSLLGDQKEIGFIAQEVETVIPEVVGMNYDGMKSLDYPKLTAVLCKAIQEQQTLINNLTERITALEALNG
jgi:hypothetical protein